MTVEGTPLLAAQLVTLREVVSETWRTANPRHCPVVLRDGDNKSVGACWYYLHDGACPAHGKIYEHNTLIAETEKKVTTTIADMLRHVVGVYRNWVELLPWG